MVDEPRAKRPPDGGPRLPDDTQRLAIVGRTGSGKTVAGLDHLSRASITEKPWVIYDFKGDKHIASIPYAESISVGSIPRDAGVYVVRPRPLEDDEAVAEQMRAIWEREDIGVYIDEGYMIPRSNKPFQWLLTQGRSKSCPMIISTQRPKMLPTNFIVSESDFFRIFRLSDDNDRERIIEYIETDAETAREKMALINPRKLPEFYSYYYDVAKGDLSILAPSSTPEEIMSRFEARLKPPETKPEDVITGKRWRFV